MRALTDLPPPALLDAPACRLRSAVDATPNLVALFDEHDRLIFANTAFRQAHHVAMATETSWRDIIREAFALGVGPVIETTSIEDWLARADTRRGTQPFRSFEASFHDGRWFLVTETMQPDGSLLLVAVDITAVRADTRTLREERDRAVRAAWTDPLTGLANRRYCTERLEQMSKQPEGGPAGALALIDLDHFKDVNDRYGHEVGDAVLVDFARFTLDRIRLQDLFGRIGGEEFLLFMPDCPVSLASQRLGRMMEDLRDRTPVGDIPDLRYTFSCGLVAIAPGADPTAALHDADQLLYQAKLNGRARVELAHG